MLAFILTIVIIYIFYYIWIVVNFDKNGKARVRKSKKSKSKKLKSENEKMPAEIKYFVVKYDIDISKVNYRYFLQLMGLVISFDLAIVITIVSYIDKFWLQLLLGFVLMLLIVLTSFHLLGKYFKKKGLTNNV